IRSTFALPGVPVAFQPGTGIVCKYTNPGFWGPCAHTGAIDRRTSVQQPSSRDIFSAGIVILLKLSFSYEADCSVETLCKTRRSKKQPSGFRKFCLASHGGQGSVHH